MKRRLLLLCLVSLSLLCPPRAQAWNDTGHKIVARITWEHMRPDVRQRMIALLGDAPPALEKVSIEEIEQATGLRFRALIQADTYGS